MPGFVVLATLASLGPGLLITALNVNYRDFRCIIPFMLQFGLYASPVGFSSAVVPESWRFWYSLNPVVGVIAFLEAMASGTPALGLAARGAVDALADGELGTKASGADFLPVLVRPLATPRPDPLALAGAVRSRFGYAAFSRQVSSILARILRARGRPIAPGSYAAGLIRRRR